MKNCTNIPINNGFKNPIKKSEIQTKGEEKFGNYEKCFSLLDLVGYYFTLPEAVNIALFFLLESKIYN